MKKYRNAVVGGTFIDKQGHIHYFPEGFLVTDNEELQKELDAIDGKQGSTIYSTKEIESAVINPSTVKEPVAEASITAAFKQSTSK